METVNVTLALPKVLREELERRGYKRLSEGIRVMLERKLRHLKEVDRIVQKSRLTEQDALELGAKINRGLGRRARQVLDEMKVEDATHALSR